MADVYDAFHERNTYLSRKYHNQRKYQENHISFNIENVHHIIHNILIGYILSSQHLSILSSIPIGILINLVYSTTRLNTWLYHLHEYKRETWETDNYLQGEIDEMIEIYHKKYQVPARIAESILNQMSDFKSLFIDHMMVLELDIKPPNSNIHTFTHTTMYSLVIGSIGVSTGTIIRYMPAIILFPTIQLATLFYNQKLHHYRSFFTSFKFSILISSLSVVVHCLL